MHNKIKWIGCFSFTGQELQELCKRIGRWPDAVITNAKDVDESAWNTHTTLMRILPTEKINSATYRALFDQIIGVDDTAIVTLHGWMKIVPADICDEYTIYNGHPGDIVRIPALKGANPQEKAFKMGLNFSGAVIHRCTKELDGGPIVAYDKCCISDCKSVDAVSARLKKVSINLWQKTLNHLL